MNSFDIDSMVTATPRPPEVNLCAAMLKLAVDDYLFWRVTNKRVREGRSAERYIFNDPAPETPLSFGNVCLLLEISPDRVRSTLADAPHETRAKMGMRRLPASDDFQDDVRG